MELSKLSLFVRVPTTFGQDCRYVRLFLQKLLPEDKLQEKSAKEAVEGYISFLINQNSNMLPLEHRIDAHKIVPFRIYNGVA